MSWRTNPFTIGKAYRIKNSFKSLQFAFHAGDIVRFVSQGYNRYDSATIYNFQDAITGENLQWWLADDEPETKWMDLFELVN